MDISTRLGFPIDRSLDDSPAGRSRVVVAVGPFVPVSTDRSPPELIAFAALFVFSRLLQLDVLQARLAIDGSISPGTPVEASFEADATLEEALETVRVGTESEAPEVDLAIARQTGGEPDVYAGNVLTFSQGAGRLQLSLDFDAANLAAVSARDFLEKIGLVLDRLGTAPDTRCSELVLLTHTARPLIPDLTRAISEREYEFIPSVFLSVARQYPECPAIANDTDVYTYAELSAAVSHLANRLVRAGLATGETVAIDGFSSFGVLASLLAVLTAGGVVVTLDRALPEERRTLIAELSRARLRILVRPNGDLDPPEADTIVTTDWPTRTELDALPAEAPPSPELPADASAYIFFTSGSTGVPKGVLGTHLGLAHFLEWERSSFRIGRGDHTAQLTALSFDVVLRDILYPLTSGACVHIPRREILFDARRMLRWIGACGITAMHCVPSLMKAWLLADTGNRPFGSLRYIFFAGEPLTDALLERFVVAAGPETTIINLYGPTETTLAKLANRIDRIEPGVQPVGKPMPGTDVVIVRDRRTICGLWETGEIAIRTRYRSKGYLGNAALTQQVFVPNPFRDDPDDQLYNTGDLGRYRSDGKLEIFGRIDAQIKIRGVRIEPNEIESLLLKFSGVRDAAVTVRLAGNAEKALIGLVVTDTPIDAGDKAAFGRAVCDFLKQRLPEAMVPTRVVVLDKLPYLPNGKLDRKSIGAMELDPQGEESPSPRIDADLDEKARRIVAGFEEALGQKIVDLDKSFVDLGGDSLSYIGLSMVIEDELRYLPSGWEDKPLAELIRLGQAAGRASASSWWTRLDSTVLFRAIAIFLVTLSHTGRYAFIEATSTLFLISGMNFSKFLRPGIRETGSLGPTLRFIARFAIPAGLWEAIRGLAFDQFWIPDILLLGTFFKNPHSHFTFWFLDVLAANVLLLAVIAKVGLWLRRRRPLEEAGPQSSFRADLFLCLMGLGIAFAQVFSGWWDGDPGATSVAPFKWLWMLVLGMVVTQANTSARKCLVTGLIGLLAWAAYSKLPYVTLMFGRQYAFFFVSAVLLVWLERVPVPRVLYRPLAGIASATLFIYIVNYSVINRLMPQLGLPAWWPVQAGAAIVAGIATKVVWDFLSARMQTRFGRGKRRLTTGWDSPAVK